MDASTLGEDDVVVRAPSGAQLAVRLGGTSDGGATAGVSGSAWYEIAPPGGRWDPTDNGQYTVEVPGGAATDDVGLPVGGTTQAFTIAVPPGSPPDGYIPPPPPPPVDLALSFTRTRIPARVLVGDTLTPTVVLKNVGEGTVNGPVTIELGLDPVDESSGSWRWLADVEREVRLAPGRSVRLKLDPAEIRYTVPEGRYVLSASADDDFLGEDDGARSRPFNVAERNIEMVSSGPTTLVPVRSNNPGTLVSFRVRNIGNAPATGKFYLDVYGLLLSENADDGRSSIGRESGPLASRETTINLRPGQQKTFKFNLGTNGRPFGKYALWLEGDSEEFDGGFIQPGD
jgi:hypothetical protein